MDWLIGLSSLAAAGAMIFWVVRRKWYVGSYPGLVVLAVYLAACLTPAMSTPGLHGGDPIGARGWLLLYAGAWVILLREPTWWLAWWANPVLLVGWILLVSRRPRWAGILGGVALVLSVGIWLPPAGEPMVGYFLWVGSMVALVAGSQWTRDRLARAPQPEASSDDAEDRLSEGW